MNYDPQETTQEEYDDWLRDKEIRELTAENERLRKVLETIAAAELIRGLYHGGETYCGLNQRIKKMAADAIAPRTC